MKGLFLKDLYTMKKHGRLFWGMIAACFLLYLFLGDAMMFFLIYPCMLAANFPITLISYDEHEKWDRYSKTLPCSPTAAVTEKYLFGLMTGGVSLAGALLCLAAKWLAAGTFRAPDFFLFAAVLLLLCSLGPSISLPFIFRFGAEKGRIAYFCMVGFCCCVGFLSASFSFAWNLTLGVVAAILCALSALCYLISWRISSALYRRREL